MSPEQVSDAFGAVSDKSDVYALGLILYELLTEQLPDHCLTTARSRSCAR